MMNDIEVNFELACNERFCNGQTIVLGKPSPEDIEQLRAIKKIRRAQMLEECNVEDAEAKEIILILASNSSGHKSKTGEKIELAIEKIKAYLQKRNISSFSREFLKSMLQSYYGLSERSMQRYATEILKKAKKTERIIEKTYMHNSQLETFREKKAILIECFCF